MDLERLRTFIMLSELKSFTEVADNLFISQPAVSKQIKSLEHELGVPLFNRVGQKNYLTIQGESFKPYAQSILNTYAIAKEHILQIENLEHGNIHFGATNFIGVYLLPEILSQFKIKYDNIDIHFKISSSKKLLTEFDKESIEFAFLSGYVSLSPISYVTKKIFDDELKVVVPSNHKLANRESVYLDELNDETFILKDKSSSLYRYLAQKLGENNLINRDILTISNQEGIKEAVVQNLGISFISQRAIKYELELGLLKMVKLENFDLTRNINLVYKKNHKLTPAAEAFIKCVFSYCKIE